MADEGACGDPHRAEAAEHAKALESISKEDEIESDSKATEEMMDEAGLEPGEMGEKALKKMEADARKQNDVLEAMLTRTNSILSRFMAVN